MHLLAPSLAIISFYADACRGGEHLRARPHAWGDDKAPIQVHGVPGTFAMLHNGASLLPLVAGLAPELEAQLRQNNDPPANGLCLGVVDVFDRIDLKRRIRGSLSPQPQVHPGVYCSRQVGDHAAWAHSYVSTFELMLRWKGLFERVPPLILLGPNAPSDESYGTVLPLNTSVLYYTPSFFTADILEVAHAMGAKMILFLGMHPADSARVGLELHCSIQVVDGGKFALTSASVGSPITTLSSSRPLLIKEREHELLWRAGWNPFPVKENLNMTLISLNGPWRAEVEVEGWPRFPLGEIIVPFAPQSARGNLETKISAHEFLWYHIPISTPAAKRVDLLIDACDWDCVVFINEEAVARHSGGYDTFAVSMPINQTILLSIRVHDPTDEGCRFVQEPPIPCEACCPSSFQPRGKQTLESGFIMYTAVTGLWRSGVFLKIWNECSVSEASIRGRRAQITITDVHTSCGDGPLKEFRVSIDRHVFDIVDGKAVIPAIRLWSPDDPYLYEVFVSTGKHDSHALRRLVGVRDVAVRNRRFELNNKVLFGHGVLLQGYWPESLLTPPTEDAVWDEVRQIKEAGFNLVRVHAVVMPDYFYAACDKLGLMVMQDMPAGDSRAQPPWEAQRWTLEMKGMPDLDEIQRSDESWRHWVQEFTAMVRQLTHFASVIIYVPFNEAWGQSHTKEALAIARRIDDRLVDVASGWNDPLSFFEWEGDAGDFLDLHNYDGKPFKGLNTTFSNYPFPEGDRARALGEYGGLGSSVGPEHEWDIFGSWAYGDVLEDRDVFLQTLRETFLRLRTLVCDIEVPLSLAVYTQWNDVETEVNGLVSYDRVPKLPFEVLRELGQILNCFSQTCSGGECPVRPITM